METKSVCLFVRVSTDKQNQERQFTDLNQYCSSRGLIVTKTISSTISGAKTLSDRPDLKELFDSARHKEFNKVIVTELSRLGRNSKDIRNTIDYLHKYKIPVIFQNLGGMESLDENGNETFVTNIIISIYGELAQEERRILTERVKSGMNNAKLNGKQIGRSKGTVKDDTKLLKEYSKLVIDLKNGLSLNQCVKVHEVSKNTVIKIKKLL